MNNFFRGSWFLPALLTLYSAAGAQSGVPKIVFHAFHLDVIEERDEKVGLVDSRPVEIPEGKMRSIFIGNLTVDLTAQQQKKNLFFHFRAVTLGPFIASREGSIILDSARSFSVTDLPGKTGSRYRLNATYLGRRERGVDCSFEDFEWQADPAARFNFGFVRHTWGDFHWNLMRDRVEDLADSLSRVFNLSTSQRPEYYFAPCLLSDWVWDGRFYFSLEPARRRAISAYSREANSFSPWVPNLLRVYLAWGYAPAPLAEGAAAFFDYPHFFAQAYLQEGKLDSVSQFITSHRYRKLPAERGLMEAASFIRFLVERYGVATFEELYRRATDLTVRDEIQNLYQKPLAELDGEWRAFLFAFRPQPGSLRQLAREDFFNYRYGEAIGFLQRALDLDTVPAADKFEEVATLFYNLGQYDSALAYYRRAHSLDSVSWPRTYVLANFYLLQDDTAEAARFYQRALNLDSRLADGLVRLGTHHFESGNFWMAESLYRLGLKKETRPDDLAELNLNLGFITWKLKGNFNQGNEMLNAAWSYYRQVLGNAPGAPLPYLRLGELFMYKNMADSAEANLKFALYLETRPYYLGKIFVRLGNLYDILNRREEAKESYQHVKSLRAAPLELRRARAYLKKPFSFPIP